MNFTETFSLLVESNYRYGNNMFLKEAVVTLETTWKSPKLTYHSLYVTLSSRCRSSISDVNLKVATLLFSHPESPAQPITHPALLTPASRLIRAANYAVQQKLDELHPHLPSTCRLSR
jgi:hypothetical protein